ncbi:amidohydrolase family protein, partial [Oharaeibacter diazotrophicus]
MTRLAVTGGLVADPASGLLAARDLLVEGRRIVAVESPGTLDADTVLDARDRLVLPAFVNAHTHGHANLAKGVADRWTLEVSLTNAPWLGGARSPEEIYISTLLGAVDMLSKGCTACFDLVYEFPRPTVEGFMAVARAYADAGMRAVLAPMVADRSLFAAIPGLADALPPDLRAAVGRFDLGGADATLAALADIVAVRGDLPEGISLALAPTIPHHCSDPFLAATVKMAAANGLLVHMHVAESRLQAVAARRLWGVSPVRRLADRGVLSPRFVAAHAVWLDGDDFDLLAAHGCKVAHVPASNLRLGAGVAALRPMLERGIPVGLATDGANSSDALSMPQAIRLASAVSRIFDGPREDWLGAREVLTLATAGGADLLGLPAAGRIAPGADADLVFYDLGHVDFVPANDVLNQVVTAADGAAITDVMAGGRLVVRDGRPTTVDLAALRPRIAETVARLTRDLADARALAAR